MFQSSQPLVRVLYQKANELVRQCMLMFIKLDVVGHGFLLPTVNSLREWNRQDNRNC